MLSLYPIYNYINLTKINNLRNKVNQIIFLLSNKKHLKAITKV